MSQELIKARKRLGTVSSLLKQGKPMVASQALTDSLLAILKEPLMKSERDEFTQLLTDAVMLLNNDSEMRKHYPLVIQYTPGDEKGLLITMHNLLKAFQEQVTEDAQQDLAALEKRKQAGLEQGQALLDAEDLDEARKVFNQLVKEFKTDSNLKADIADRYIKHKLYEDAFRLLEDALKYDPNAILLYNRIGMALRKMEKYEIAERYYLKALEIAKKDEYLYFNLGRLYFDWGKWKKMAEAAVKALEISPNFNEANKMLAFAKKKLG